MNRQGAKVAKGGAGGALAERTPVARPPLETLTEQTRRPLDPGNMFVVPQLYGGLGEVPAFSAAFRDRTG